MTVQNPSEQFSPADEVEALRAELAAAKDSIRFALGERDGAWDQNIELRAELAQARRERDEARANLANCRNYFAVGDDEVWNIIIQYNNGIERYGDLVSTLKSELAQARKERDEARAALEWYADYNNYDEDHAPGFYLRGQTMIWEYDCGDKARAALRGEK